MLTESGSSVPVRRLCQANGGDMFIRLQSIILELPTAVSCSEPNGDSDPNSVSFLDSSGMIVARFDRPDVLAFSARIEALKDASPHGTSNNGANSSALESTR